MRVFAHFVSQPIMAQNLAIKIMRLEAGVVDMGFRSFEEKEAVVVD